MREWLAGELAAQIDRWPLWTPVAFGGGCAAYFALKTEPSVWVLAALAALAVGAVLLSLRLPWRPLVIATTLLACAAAGLTIAKLRSDRVAAPLAPVTDRPVMVDGWVLEVKPPGENWGRVLLAPVAIEGLASEATPHRMTVTFVNAIAPEPGTPIRFTALLSPPSPPDSPGSYDFARDGWFKSDGGHGLSLSRRIEEINLPPPPAALKREMAINAWRWSLTDRIVKRLGRDRGGLAAAMTTGYSFAVSKEQTDDMRDSGLAHLISISGLHMAIVGGFVFFALRLLVACWPWLALRVSGKKVAAVGGLLAVGVYLVVSGHPAPAERAAITASVAFLAVLLDRKAVSFNALAVAAFIVLLLQPEAAVQAGFQMSFAATTALVALAEVWPRRIREIQAPWPITLFQRSVSWVGAAMAVSFVAGLATGPFSIQHFNQVASYGLLANVLESPISTFVTMPALALGAALETVRLGGPFLAVAGWGIDATTGIARLVARLPGATQAVACAPVAALPISFIGILFICLWKGWLRCLGLPFAAAVALWPRGDAPALWVASDGSAVAVREGKRVILMRPKDRVSDADTWRRRNALKMPLTDAERQSETDARFSCGRFSCTSRAGSTVRVSGWWGKRVPTEAELAELCTGAEVVILRPIVQRLPAFCRQALVLDGADVSKGGSVELWRTRSGWSGRWSEPARGVRPWTRPPMELVRPRWGEPGPGRLRPLRPNSDADPD